MAESERRNYKAPPAFEEGMDYNDWKLDLELWQEFTSLERKKHGTALLLELKPGKVKDTVRSLGKAVLVAENAISQITTQLDKIYKEDAAQISYRVYSKFERYCRPEQMTLQSYISEFEKLLADLKKQEIKLPPEVLAYRFLNSANLPSEKVDLALATVKALTYKDMCETVSKIFSVQANIGAIENSAVTPSVKIETEECHYTNSSSFRGRGSLTNRSRGRSQSSYHPYKQTPRSSSSYSGCYVCGGKDHSARNCPERKNRQAKRVQEPRYYEQYLAQEDPRNGQGAEPISQMEAEDSMATAYMTFMVADNESTDQDCFVNSKPNLGSLVYETLACAVIDSGCTKTVVGRNWVNCYRDTLDDKELRMMTSEKCQTPFRFGDGEEVKSYEKIKIPGCIGKSRILIEANIVDKDLPLLLSKASMKKAGAMLDFKNDKMVFNGEAIDLFETKSKHYCVPLCIKRRLFLGPDERKPNLVLNVTEETLLGQDHTEIMQKAEKLHKQFSHPRSESLKALLRNAGFSRKEYMKAIDDVSSSCKICLMYKTPKPRPIVGLPRGKTFNECVAMDLKQVPENPGVYILHMIDTVTRYSAARIIYNKRKETIIDGLCSGWISLFGNPVKFMADNGGEFSNREYNELCERFNIDVQNSAAESPWSNGLVERHHKMLVEMMLKTKEDSKCSWETALCWALSAKNSMQMFGGFSANQLVMGKNPSFPNVIDDRLPALEESVVSKTVADNVNAMNSARQAFSKCESSNKIRKALRSQVRTSNSEFYQNGEKVMYKRKGSMKWSGPGVVLGRDSTHYILKHGNQYYKCSPIHMTRCTTLGYPLTSKCETTVSSDPCSAQSSQKNYLEHSEPIRNGVQPEMDPVNDISENIPPMPATAHEPKKTGLPKAKSHVQFIPKYPETEDERDTWVKAFIHSRAGKATGSYRNCLNIQLEGDEDIKCVDWHQLALEWKDDSAPEREEEVLLSTVCSYEQAVVDAKQKELEKFRDNDVYEEVDNTNQSTVGVRWVVTKKPDGSVKARLVALGYQEKSSDIRKDSPTCNRDSIRLLLTVVAQQGWKLQHIDVQTAFLQGKRISRDVFIVPPKEAETWKIWKLNKCIYGLVDGPRMWYMELRDTLVKLRMEVSSYDESFMFWNSQGKLSGIMAIHVDDLMLSGNKAFENYVICGLKKKFRLSTEAEVEFVYTGLDIKQTSLGVQVSQLGYIDQIPKIEIDKHRVNQNSLEINEHEKRQLRTVCGQLLWVSTQTRPDLAYATCFASNCVNNGTVADLKMVNKAVKFLKREPLTIKFRKVSLCESLVVVFCDASFGNLRDGSSQGGFIIFLVSTTSKCCPLTWQSRKIRRVCKSTLAAESWAMVEAVESAELVQAQLCEVTHSPKMDIVVMTDCKSLHDALHTSKNVDDKGLRIPMACLRQRVCNNEMRVYWISTKLQLADCLTKAGAPTHPLREVLSTGQLNNDLYKTIFGN